MKKLFFIIVITFSSLIVNAQSITFINKEGGYRPLNEETDFVGSFSLSSDSPKGSFNYYVERLGYMKGEVISCFTDEYIYALNLFNNEVIFVIPLDSSIESLSKNTVDDNLINYLPGLGEFASKLEDGVNNMTIRESFVKESLNINTVNSTIKDEAHGFTYTFENGFLVSYSSLSGLSNRAIYIKENIPAVFTLIETNAKSYYGVSDILVNKYINEQCEYFAGIDMTYLRLASDSNINYNYALLYCIFYPGMKLDDFVFLVPEAKISSSIGNYVSMSYGSYVFLFKDNILVKE